MEICEQEMMPPLSTIVHAAELLTKRFPGIASDIDDYLPQLRTCLSPDMVVDEVFFGEMFSLWQRIRGLLRANGVMVRVLASHRMSDLYQADEERNVDPYPSVLSQGPAQKPVLVSLEVDERHASAVAPLYFTEWGRQKFVHGADMVRPVTELVCALLSPGEALAKMSEIVFKKLVTCDLSLHAHVDESSDSGEACTPRDVAVRARFETTSGRTVFVTGTPCLDARITHKVFRNPFASKLVCECEACMKPNENGAQFDMRHRTPESTLTLSTEPSLRLATGIEAVTHALMMSRPSRGLLMYCYKNIPIDIFGDKIFDVDFEDTLSLTYHPDRSFDGNSGMRFLPVMIHLEREKTVSEAIMCVSSNPTTTARVLSPVFHR